MSDETELFGGMEFDDIAHREVERLRGQLETISAQITKLRKEYAQLESRREHLVEYLRAANPDQQVAMEALSSTFTTKIESRAHRPATVEDIQTLFEETGKDQLQVREIFRLLGERGTPVNGRVPIQNLSAKLSDSPRFAPGDKRGWWRLANSTQPEAAPTE